jgi:hypothetical protein
VSAPPSSVGLVMPSDSSGYDAPSDPSRRTAPGAGAGTVVRALGGQPLAWAARQKSGSRISRNNSHLEGRQLPAGHPAS